MRSTPAWLWVLGGAILLVLLTSGGVVTANYLSAIWMSSANARKWASALTAAENQYSLPPGLLARIAYQESHFVQRIIDGTEPSSAGALGLMQLEPQYFSTVQRPVPFSEQDTLDQILEAAQLLSDLFAHFGDWTEATAAYNAGQTAIDHVIAHMAPLASETAKYVASVSTDLPDIISPTLNV